MKHYVLFYEFCADYLSRREAHRGAHLALARASVERDELQLGGALPEEPLGLLLFKAASADVVERFAAQDPYVIHGVVTSFRIREWVTVVGRDALSPVGLTARSAAGDATR